MKNDLVERLKPFVIEFGEPLSPWRHAMVPVHMLNETIEALSTTPGREEIAEPKFKRGDRVEKISGSSWRGLVVGEYSTALTPEGYAVESETETGSVQIYPAKALQLLRKEGAEYPATESEKPNA